MKNNKVNFLTPNGLKVQLNCGYFFYQLTKADRYYTNEEIVDNETMYNATKTIENLYVTATALIQVFSIVAIIFTLICVYFVSLWHYYTFSVVFYATQSTFSHSVKYRLISVRYTKNVVFILYYIGGIIFRA